MMLLDNHLGMIIVPTPTRFPIVPNSKKSHGYSDRMNRIDQIIFILWILSIGKYRILEQGMEILARTDFRPE